MHFKFLFGAIAVCIASSTFAQDFPATKGLRVDALMEKRDAVMHIDHALLSAFVDDHTFDGLMGRTRDFRGQEMPAFVIFDKSVPETKLMALSNFHGKIQGSVECKRIRVGSSPDRPDIKIAALGEECKVVAIDHYR